MIQEGLEEGFVIVMIRLGFQQDNVHMHGQLFDHGVGQIGDGVEGIHEPDVAAPTFLESDLHFKKTPVWVDEGLGGWNKKFHGVDTRGDGPQLCEPYPLHGCVCLGDLKDL